MKRSIPDLARWFAVLWAVGAYAIVPRMPLYRSMSTSLGGGTVETSATLADVNGPHIYGVLLVPVLAALFAVAPWPSRVRRAASIGAAAVATLFVVLGAMTVGTFFLPTALSLVVAAAWPVARRSRHLTRSCS